MASPRARQGGAALLLVVWVIALLGLLAAATLQLVTVAGHISQSNLQRAQLEAAADGATNLALLRLMDPAPGEHWKLDGTAQSIDIGGMRVRVSVQDEAGKIDVNNAPIPIVAASFRNVGLSPRDAGALEAAMSRFRGNQGSSNTKRYFRTPEEFLQLVTVPVNVRACIKTAVTVYTGLEGVDLRYASAPVRQAVQEASGGSTIPSNVERDGSVAGRILSISAGAEQAGYAVAEQRVVRITGDPSQLQLVALWKVADEPQESINSERPKGCPTAH